MNKAITPPSGLENWEFITRLAKEMGMGYKFDYSSIEDIRNEMKTLIPIYRTVDFECMDQDQTWDLSAVRFPDITGRCITDPVKFKRYVPVGTLNFIDVLV